MWSTWDVELLLAPRHPTSCCTPLAKEQRLSSINYICNVLFRSFTFLETHFVWVVVYRPGRWLLCYLFSHDNSPRVIFFVVIILMSKVAAIIGAGINPSTLKLEQVLVWEPSSQKGIYNILHFKNEDSLKEVMTSHYFLVLLTTWRNSNHNSKLYVYVHI